MPESIEQLKTRLFIVDKEKLDSLAEKINEL